MYTLRPDKALEYVSDYGRAITKGNIVSVTCCMPLGKTLLATAGIAENIKNNVKTCQVFVCPRLLHKQRAEEIYDNLAENHLLASVVLYDSTKYEGKRNIHECSNHEVTEDEFFTGRSHVVIIADHVSIQSGKDIFEKILKNNEDYGRKNAAIIYDEVNIIKELANFFNVSVLMSEEIKIIRKEITYE